MPDFFMVSIPPWNFSGSSFTLTILSTCLHRLYFFISLDALDIRVGILSFPAIAGRSSRNGALAVCPIPFRRVNVYRRKTRQIAGGVLT
jgi:hypothetical protein